jgi:hypothetical protein
MACTSPSTLTPMTLMGKSDGYSMSDSLGGMSGLIGVDTAFNIVRLSVSMLGPHSVEGLLREAKCA